MRKAFTSPERNMNSPPLNKVLPHIITKTIRIGKFLDEMLNGILSKTEKVGARNRVGMLTITDRICLLHNTRPCSCCSTGDDRFVGSVRWNDLEFWSITTIKDRTVINDFNPRIDGGQISPVSNRTRNIGDQKRKK